MKRFALTAVALTSALMSAGACTFLAVHTPTEAKAKHIKQSYFFKCVNDESGRRCAINAPVLDGSGRLQAATLWVRDGFARLVMNADMFEAYRAEQYGGLQRIYLRSVTTEARAVITITVEGVSVSVVDHDGKPVMVGSNL